MCGGAHLLNVTAQVPGVQVSEIAESEAEPLQLWGPLRVTLPLAVTLPLKPSKGGAKVNEQPDCETTAFIPTSEESQCIATLHVPDRLGHEPPPVPPEAGESDESDPQP
jgi:hypothetical protein